MEKRDEANQAAEEFEAEESEVRILTEQSWTFPERVVRFSKLSLLACEHLYDNVYGMHLFLIYELIIYLDGFILNVFHFILKLVEIGRMIPNCKEMKNTVKRNELSQISIFMKGEQLVLERI